MQELIKPSDFLPIPNEIVSSVANLKEGGCLPNGLKQLIVGSVMYRPGSLFIDSGANQGLFMRDPGFDEIKRQWMEKYNGYSGDNLAATALYQHERYDPDNKQFPKPETPRYTALVKQMGELGSFLKEIHDKNGWETVQKTLSEIGSKIETHSYQ